MVDLKIGDKTYHNVKRVRFNLADKGTVVYGSEGLWAYLNQGTLFLNQADDFIQDDTSLEVVIYG
jgi:hypothetical protein